MSDLSVRLVAATATVWEGQAHMVRARGIDGDLGILPGHQPLLTVLADEGEVIISGGEAGTHTVAVSGGGFLSVDHDAVTILVERADS